MVRIFTPLPLCKRSHSATSASLVILLFMLFLCSSSFIPHSLFLLVCLAPFLASSCDNSLMGFSCGDDLSKKEIEFVLIDESIDTADRDGMDVRNNGVEGEVEFWPIEHPVEPSDEDRPVKCPIPHSSVINEDGGMKQERYCESFRARAEAAAAMASKEGKVEEGEEEPPIRAVRKRHHTLTQGDHHITPLLRMPPLPRFPTQDVPIFQMLRQFDKFES